VTTTADELFGEVTRDDAGLRRWLHGCILVRPQGTPSM
jgi:hypothetical protein